MDKNKFITLLMEQLFAPETRRLAIVINKLSGHNKILKRAAADGFLYGGILYMPTGSVVTAGPNQAKTSLDLSLNSEMDTWIQDQKAIRCDQDLVKQMLFRLLKPCKSVREIRNTLPECLISLVPELNAEPRTDPAGYTLEGDERAKRQFDKLLPKIEMYSVTRFLY